MTKLTSSTQHNTNTYTAQYVEPGQPYARSLPPSAERFLTEKRLVAATAAIRNAAGAEIPEVCAEPGTAAAQRECYGDLLASLEAFAAEVDVPSLVPWILRTDSESATFLLPPTVYYYTLQQIDDGAAVPHKSVVSKRDARELHALCVHGSTAEYRNERSRKQLLREALRATAATMCNGIALEFSPTAPIQFADTESAGDARRIRVDWALVVKWGKQQETADAAASANP